MCDEQCGISVIIPAYKVEEYLRRCLDSVAAQSFTDFEAIVVNDCSPDGVAEIAREYCCRDGRFRLINQPRNMGTMEARRAGYESARGRYLVFLDSDDYLPVDALRILYESVTEGGYDIVFAGYEKVYPDGRSEVLKHITDPAETKEDIYKALILNRMPWVLCIGIYKRELFGNILTVEGLCLNEDYVVLLQVVKLADQIRFIDDVVYYYYQSAGSATRIKDSIGKVAQNIKAANIWLDFYVQNDIHVPLACRAYNRKIVRALEAGFSMRQIRSVASIDSGVFSACGLLRYNSLRYLLKAWWLMVWRAVGPKRVE